MKKIGAKAVILVAFVSVVAMSLATVLVQAQDEEPTPGQSGDAGPQPIQNAMASLVQDGVITQTQAESVMERLAPAIRQTVAHQVHSHATLIKKEADRFLQAELKKKHNTSDDKAIQAEQHKAVLDLLGIDKKELHTRLKSGETLAAITTGQGVTTADVVTAVVGPVQARIEKAQAAGKLSDQEAAEKLKEARRVALGHIEGAIDRKFGSKSKAALSKEKAVHSIEVQQHIAVLKLLGIDKDDLRVRMRAGESLVSIARDLGVESDEVVTALLNPIQKKLQFARDKGQINDDQMAEHLDKAGSEIITQFEAQLGSWWP